MARLRLEALAFSRAAGNRNTV